MTSIHHHVDNLLVQEPVNDSKGWLPKGSPFGVALAKRWGHITLSLELVNISHFLLFNLLHSSFYMFLRSGARET